MARRTNTNFNRYKCTKKDGKQTLADRENKDGTLKPLKYHPIKPSYGWAAPNKKRKNRNKT